jgi:signal transduction histidine kinase
MVARQGRTHISIERKLPLLITALLLVLVAIGSWAAYRQVRVSAVDANRSNLERAAGQLANLIGSSGATRLQQMSAAGLDRAVRVALAGGPVEGATESLRPFFSTEDSLSVELRRPNGSIVTRLGRYPDGWSEDEIRRVRSLDGTTSGYSDLRIVNGKPYLWLVAPLRNGETVIGSIAELISVGDSASSAVGQLIGPSSSVYYTNQDGGPWVRLDGSLAEPAFADPMSPPATYTLPDGRGTAAAATALAPNSRIAIIVASPMDVVLAGPRSFLRWLVFGSLVLVLIGATAAWLLSRRITRPLRDLANAAREIAEDGDPREVEVGRQDEIGELAAAFNRMGSEIRQTHAALRGQALEANEARAEAEEASRAKSQFLATMSHELRTPINAIIGYADLLLMGVPEPISSAQRAQMERIHASGQYLLRMIDEVLDLSRIEVGRLQIEEEMGLVIEVVESVLQVTTPAADERGVALLPTDPDLLAGMTFLGDRHRVTQILVNLVSNAIKFTEPGGEVHLEIARSGDSVDFVVRDTGIGIAADEMDRIFEPFVQADQSYTRTYGGVGLGLSISRELARLMGGDVTVVSEPGKGSEFTLRLPGARVGIAAA